jgi:hypothetical protein
VFLYDTSLTNFSQIRDKFLNCFNFCFFLSSNTFSIIELFEFLRLILAEYGFIDKFIEKISYLQELEQNNLIFSHFITQTFDLNKIKEGMDILRSGFWIKSNQENAFNIFCKSAEEENPESYWRLSVCYLFGYGVKKNIKKAIEYAELSCKYLSDNGFFWLGQSNQKITESSKYFENPQI